MADWNKIRKEYIKTNISQRALAKKYGVCEKSVAKRSKAEGWVALRQQAVCKSTAKTVSTIANENGKVETKMQGAALALIEKATEGIELTNPADAKTLKSYSGVLRDVKEILNLRSGLDIREQEARIENLRRQAEAGKDENGAVEVVFNAGDPGWNE